MQQMLFKEAIEPLQALIAQAETEIEQLEVARKDKKKQLKQLQKSLAQLTGGNGTKPKAKEPGRDPADQGAWGRLLGAGSNQEQGGGGSLSPNSPFFAIRTPRRLA
ncbi:MAG: hypothetical protein HY651_03830 [Acidobacteria bacterium]|nr:hypothetical protein [Acidobacteriota bacterium]